MLARLDATAAERIAARDTPKLVRAIEVCLLTGRPISEVYRAGRTRLEGFAPIKVGLLPAREALYARIEQRVEAMLAAGWLEEVRQRIAEGVPATAKAFQFIGYRELRAHLGGVVTLKQAVKATKQATRRYAKRQITWFRKETGVRWFAGFGDDAATADTVLAYLNEQPGLQGWPRPAGRAAV
jgi:tRNA dimethylallyltransferase